MNPESEDQLSEFASRLNNLIREYPMLSNAEVIGILKLMSDDISQKCRTELQGPHELS